MRPLRTRSAHLLIGAALVFGVAACSDDDGDNADDTTAVTDAPDDTAGADTVPPTTGDVSTPGTVSGDDAAACEAIRPISEYDAQTGPLVQAGDWDAIQAFIVDSEADIVAAYDETASLVPELADDVETLRDLTVDYTAAAAEASDLATWTGDVTELATVDYPSAGEAGLALNTWAVEHCGFATGGQ